ncbi:hypothetical protein SAMD00019534_024800, partial [Acytostelium subglobosum LB1]|uniref:hypothetical protein n=1 Tax=Acytostelium subglobosum LB1 TaxID=1410327 RepID=UPI000644FE77
NNKYRYIHYNYNNKDTVMASTNFVATQNNTDVFNKDIRKIRYDVFVIEQQCPVEEEWDEHDAIATHYLLTDNGVPVACSRSRQYHLDDGTDVVKLERFAVLKEHRGKKYGKVLVEETIKRVYELNKDRNFPCYIINAQQYVEKFYEKLGFITDTNIPIFYEANIPHVRMAIPIQTVKSIAGES